MSTRCKGSGDVQYLDWPQTDNYPGAVVCIECSLGVPVRRPSVHYDEKEGRWYGTVRVHDRPKAN
jgi:hypothetical protein